MKYYGNQNIAGKKYSGYGDWSPQNRIIDLIKENSRTEDALQEYLVEEPKEEIDHEALEEQVINWFLERGL